jgi:hypothetical protein
MWIVADTGFVSMVRHRDHPGLLLVRARVAADITNLFGPGVEITTDPEADYRYRATVAKNQAARVIMAKVYGIDYESHVKDVAVERSAPAEGRLAAYYNTWVALNEMQC